MNNYTTTHTQSKKGSWNVIFTPKKRSTTWLCHPR